MQYKTKCSFPPKSAFATFLCKKPSILQLYIQQLPCIRTTLHQPHIQVTASAQLHGLVGSQGQWCVQFSASILEGKGNAISSLFLFQLPIDYIDCRNFSKVLKKRILILCHHATRPVLLGPLLDFPYLSHHCVRSLSHAVNITHK